MRKIISYTAVAALIVMCCSCAKEHSSITNDAAKRYFYAWLHVHGYDDCDTTSLGVRIIKKENANTDRPVVDGAEYLLVNYSQKDLDGNFTSTTYQKDAEQVGTFSPSSYYGPVFWLMSESLVSAAIFEATEDMRIGEKRTLIVPGWLQTVTRYSTVAEYIANVTENSPIIYTIEVIDTVMNMKYRQAKMIENYLSSRKIPLDSLQYGFYYKSLKTPVSEEAMPEDTTVYINYTGRLLMRNIRTDSYDTTKVFDTTIGDTAKVAGIHSTSNTYAPVRINWAADSLSITMGSSSSSVIQGFARTLWHMKPMEKAFGVFMSDLGYGSQGSGSSIPGYAPLLFEIEMVENEE